MKLEDIEDEKFREYIIKKIKLEKSECCDSLIILGKSERVAYCSQCGKIYETITLIADPEMGSYMKQLH